MNKLLIALMIRAQIPLAFESGTDGSWKMDGDTPVFKDGNPVWVNADGSEAILQRDTISRLNAEAKQHRTKAEQLAESLKPFEGLDPRAAREAMDKLKGIDLSKMIDSGKLDEVRNQLKTEYGSQIGEKDKHIEGLQGKLNSLITDNAFNASNFIRENIAIPVEIFRAAFGKHFKVENDQLQAFDKAGNRLLSKKNIGEFAEFDEAVEMLVEAYPQRDAILKAPEQRGSGSEGNGGNQGSGRTMKMTAFTALPPGKQAEFAALVREGKAKLVD